MKYTITVIDDSPDSVFAHGNTSVEPVIIKRRTAVDFEMALKGSMEEIRINRYKQVWIDINDKVCTEWSPDGPAVLYSDAQSRIAALTEERNERTIWCASVDEIPDLVAKGHEICDPEPLKATEIEKMWTTLKQQLQETKDNLNQMTYGRDDLQRLVNQRDDELAAANQRVKVLTEALEPMVEFLRHAEWDSHSTESHVGNMVEQARIALSEAAHEQ